MSIVDVLTGGKSKEAASALKRAEAAFTNIQAPSAAQLTLPELQKYVQMGILTPEQAKAVLIQGNAFNDMNVDPSGLASQKRSLAGLENVGEAGGMTDEMKAQMAQALDQIATTTRGTNEGILDQAAQRGISKSLMAPAAMMASSGDAARQENLNTTQAAGQAEKNAMDALVASGNLGGQIRGQAYNEAAQKAQAENAMRQWNAGTQTNTNEANAARGTAANQFNLENAQNVGNANVDTSNKRTEYNATVPQMVFNNAITKASGQAGVNRDQASNATNAGNQMMGLFGAGIGAAGKAFAPGVSAAAQPAAQPNSFGSDYYMKNANMYAAEGAIVPGKAEVSGDSPQNDKVHAMLSPGEVVVPRSITTSPNAPELAKGFVTHLLKNRPITPAHPDDVHTLLEVLTKRRESQPAQVGATRG